APVRLQIVPIRDPGASTARVPDLLFGTGVGNTCGMFDFWSDGQLAAPASAAQYEARNRGDTEIFERRPRISLSPPIQVFLFCERTEAHVDAPALVETLYSVGALA